MTRTFGDKPASRLADWIRVLGLGSAATYLIVLPFGHTAALRGLSLLAALLASLVVWWVSEPRRLPPLLAVFCIWLVAALLSLSTSVDVMASTNAISGEVLRSFIVFFAFHTLTRRFSALPVFALATAFSACLLSILAFSSYAQHGTWVGDVLPPLGDFATTASTVMPMLVIGIVLQRELPARRLAMATAICGLLIGGYLTHSRGFWLTLFAGFAAAAMTYALARRRARKALLVGILIAGIAAVGLASMVAGEKSRALTHFDDRSVIYVPVAKKLMENPLTGTGYGHETDWKWYRGLPDVPPQVKHAHNIVLSYLDQMGPLGLLVLIGIFGVPAVRLARGWHGPAGTACGLGGLALLAAVLVKNNLDFFFWNQNLWLFFAHLAIFIGQLDRANEQDESGRPDANPAGAQCA